MLGRKTANTQFFRFLLKEDPFDRYDLFLLHADLGKDLDRFLDAVGLDSGLRNRIRLRSRMELPEAVARENHHCFHQSDCILNPAPLAALRNALSRDIFPITSVTHSLSYANFHEAFLRLLSPSISPRDCVAATSRCAVHALEAFFNRLRLDYGLDHARAPGTAIRRIPLGVDPDAMAPAGPAARDALRRSLGLASDTCCLLVFGRIAHHSKMDILPLLRALQRLINGGLERDAVHLVVAGWAEDEDEYPEQIRKLAVNLGLGFSLVKRPTEAHKTELFQAADVFISIADNPQETFGLTLLEAQAAGLPVIASDYDGYRDLAVHGRTGLLVDTLGPGETDLIDLMAPLVYDNQYHLLLAQQTVVSVKALAEAVLRLVTDPGERRAMGLAGRRRVLEEYAWPSIIRRWVDLWDELRQTPVDEPGLRASRHPLNLPYAEIFASYPTRTLGPQSVIQATETGGAVHRGKDHPTVYAMVEPFLRLDGLEKLLFLVRKPVAAGAAVDRLIDMVQDLTKQQAWATLRWALKQDLIEETTRP